MLLEFIIVASVIILDRYTKHLAAVYLKDIPGGTYPLIKDVLHFTYVENKGAAFSMMQNFRWLFIGVTIIVSFVILFYLIKHRSDSVFLNVSLSLILGGAIGNLIDRIRVGYVVDFIDFRAINFAIFNVADSAVTIGSILFAIYILFFSEKSGKQN